MKHPSSDPPSVAGPPSSPRGPVVITNVTGESADIRWQPPEYTGGTPITNYIIEIRESTRTLWRRTALVEPTSTTYKLVNLLQGQEYVVRVIARNKEGESFPLISEVISPPKARCE